MVMNGKSCLIPILYLNHLMIMEWHHEKSYLGGLSVCLFVFHNALYPQATAIVMLGLQCTFLYTYHRDKSLVFYITFHAHTCKIMLLSIFQNGVLPQYSSDIFSLMPSLER